MNEIANLISSQGVPITIIMVAGFGLWKASNAFWVWWKEFMVVFLQRWNDTVVAMNKMSDVADGIMTRQEANDLADRFLEKSEMKHQLTRQEIKLHIDKSMFPVLEELKKNE